MTQRILVFLLSSLITAGLQAQSPSSRLGLALGAASPQELHASNGMCLGLNIYFNQDSPAEGRIRFEGVNFGSKTEVTSTTVLESKGNAVTLSYDWMPGNRRVHAILGIGAMSWYQNLQQEDIFGGFPSFRNYGGSRTGFSIVPTLGVQVRLNQFFCFEGRYAFATNINNNNGYYLTYNAGNNLREMRYFTVGIEFRLPKLR